PQLESNMKLNEYAGYDAIGLAKLVAAGEVTPHELSEAALSAAHAINPTLNAIVEVWSPEARDIARAMQGGTLAGVPFLIKDLGVSMAGKRSELGSRLAEGMVAPSDSCLMRRFRQAGLVTLGRSATPEMAFSTTTESVQQGATSNPWDPTLMAGGSSGGAAAAVASGIVPLAHATDAAGSIRVPAAYTGLFGMKPTRGRSSSGPMADEVLGAMATHMGLSRSVRDSAALLDAIQCEPVGEPYYTPAPQYGCLREVGLEPGKLRIGYMAHAWNGARSERTMIDAVERVALRLEHLGHRVEQVTLSAGASWEAIVHATTSIWTAWLANGIAGLAAATGRPLTPDTLEPATLASYQYGTKVSAADYLRALDLRNTVTRAIGAWFHELDVLLTPTLPGMPLRLGLYQQGAEYL